MELTRMEKLLQPVYHDFTTLSYQCIGLFEAMMQDSKLPDYYRDQVQSLLDEHKRLRNARNAAVWEPANGN